jgi:uncharacterized protein YkwD
MISKHIWPALAAGFCALLLAGGAAAARTSSTGLGLLQAVNAARTAHHLAPLRLDARLGAAVRAHSHELLQTNTFTHGDFLTRMLRFHAVGPVVGENLAWGAGGYAAPKHVVAMWLASPEHRANLLRPGYARIGLGFAQGRFRGANGALVITADFAGR